MARKFKSGNIARIIKWTGSCPDTWRNFRKGYLVRIISYHDGGGEYPYHTQRLDKTDEEDFAARELEFVRDK